MSEALEHAADAAWAKEAQRRALRLLDAYYSGGPDDATAFLDEAAANANDKATLLLGLVYLSDFLQQENALNLGGSMTAHQITKIMLDRMEN